MTFRSEAPGAAERPGVGVHAGASGLTGAGDDPQQEFTPAAAQVGDVGSGPHVQPVGQKFGVLHRQRHVPAHPRVQRFFEIVGFHRGHGTRALPVDGRPARLRRRA
jgi:hypothetical protein